MNKDLGKIKEIKEVFDIDGMDGYKVTTDSKEIFVLIDGYQSCCESWGYFSSDDDFEKFIGSQLISLDLTDKALNNIKVEESDYYEDCGGIQFVNFTTSKGLFQLAVYNSHNGYYGHGILVKINEEVIFDDFL